VKNRELNKYPSDKKVYFDDEEWGMGLVTEVSTMPTHSDDVLLKN
jgi:hypothetical protein